MSAVHPDALVPGDVLVYAGVRCTVLVAATPAPDLFGRTMLHVWASRADTGARGWLIYGPDAVVELVGTEPPGLVLLRDPKDCPHCNPHGGAP